MLRSTSVVITTTGASPLIALSPVSRPTWLGAVAVDQVVVLLVGQRLDRGGVEALARRSTALAGAARPAAGVGAQRQVYGELADHGLAGAGRGAHQHAAAALQRLARLALERVEVEARSRRTRQAPGNCAGLGGPATGRGVPLGGARHDRKVNGPACTRPPSASGTVPLGMVHGVPDACRTAQHARPRSATPTAATARRPVEAVLFDFHGTLAQVEDPVAGCCAAAADCGVHPGPGPGHRRWPTGWSPPAGPAGRCRPGCRRTWPRCGPTGISTAHAHRAAYTGLAATVTTGIDGLAEALYDAAAHRRRAGCRTPTPIPTLRALRDAGVPVAVVSNIGFDLRPTTANLGFGELVDAFVLSYEVGRCKPDPAIFLRACAALGVDPERTLMVGDTPADAGAAAAGCMALILPASPPGAVQGLAGVLDLVGISGRG